MIKNTIHTSESVIGLTIYLSAPEDLITLRLCNVLLQRLIAAFWWRIS